MSSRPLYIQCESAKSINRYTLLNGTTGLTRFSVGASSHPP